MTNTITQTITTPTGATFEGAIVHEAPAGLEQAVQRELQLQAEMKERAEVRSRLEETARELESFMDSLDRDQRNRLLLEGDIARYEEHVSTVMRGCPDVTALWLATAAKAAGVPISKIETRPIEQIATLDGVVEHADDVKVVIRAHEGGKTETLPVYGAGKLTVKVGELVHPGNRVVMPVNATHAVVKGPRIDPLVVGYAIKGATGEVTDVIVEGKGKQGYFTLLATPGFTPRFRFGRMVRGFDRLDRLVGSSLALAAPIPGADLRAAADAAYGPCPQFAK